MLAKSCTKCREEKPLDAYSPRKAKCKVCRAQEARDRNPEAVRKASLASYYRNRERYSAASLQRYHSDPEVGRARNAAWRAANPDANKERLDTWRKANPEKVATHRNTVRTKRAAVPGKAPWATWEEIHAVYRDADRLTRETGVEHEVDHIYPVLGNTVTGLNCAANLRAVPVGPNRRKSNKLPGFLSNELWDPSSPEVFHE